MRAKKQEKKKQDFMTPAEAMHLLRISRDTFYRMLLDGKVPGAVKVGHQWRIITHVFWESMTRDAKKKAS